MEDVGIVRAILSIIHPNVIFYGNLVHFVAIWYIFFPFWYVAPRKIWQPCVQQWVGFTFRNLTNELIAGKPKWKSSHWEFLTFRHFAGEVISFMTATTSEQKATKTGVARLYIFKPNIPIWVNIEGSCNGRCWFILWYLVYFTALLCIFCGNLVYFVVIWYIFRFGMLYQEKSGIPHNLTSKLSYHHES
jgi:hypothetical protein